MRSRNYRQTLQDLKHLCRKRGIEVEVLLDAGKGSHRGIQFRDKKTGEVVRVVIAGHKDISPGVQRDIVKYLASISKIAVAEAVRAILEGLFK